MGVTLTTRDWEFIHAFLMFLSSTTFVLCVLIFITGTCITDNPVFPNDENFDPPLDKYQLQFISTQIAACLHEYAYVSWGFVSSIQIQILLLLYYFLRVVYDQRGAHCVHGLQRDRVALMTASMASFFVISLASVVEFRSISPSPTEKFYHYCSAVTSISIFFLLHSMMCYYAHLSGGEHTEYGICKNYYLTLMIFFFILWVAHSVFAQIVFYACITEWVLLCMGVLLHAYSLFVMQETFRKNQTTVTPKAQPGDLNRKTDVAEILVWVCTSFLFCVVCSISFTWTAKDSDSVYLRTGIWFWAIVSTTYLTVTCLLISQHIDLGT